MEVAAPEGFNHLFMIDYGTLAIENALKVAMDWKVRKNITKGYTASAEKGTKVIHFKEAFHGRSGYTLTLTNTADPRKFSTLPSSPTGRESPIPRLYGRWKNTLRKWKRRKRKQ